MLDPSGNVNAYPDVWALQASCDNQYIYLAHADSGYKSAHARLAGRQGFFGQMHYLANVPGIDQILAIKVLMSMGGGGWGGVVQANGLFG